MSDSFLITGMSRSGTTLLEKLLAGHPEMDVLSQPMPLVYRHLKERFHRSIGYPSTRYVLNDLFCESRYSPGDLVSFLCGYSFSEQVLRDLFAEMEAWDGQKTRLPEWREKITSRAPLGLQELYDILLDEYGLASGPGAKGTKEILIEEFIPYFLEREIRVILIVRDPRDVITSIQKGRGPSYTGEFRPTLFHLRNWRKSVALANTWFHHPGFLCLTYEELITSPESALNRVAAFLNVSLFKPDQYSTGIRTREGNNWGGNSSTESTFAGIDSRNAGKFRQYLDEATLRYIEYICEPEMNRFGYEPAALGDRHRYEPSGFREPVVVKVRDLNSDMSFCDKELKKEKRRRDLLACTDAVREEICRYFFSERNFTVLADNFQRVSENALMNQSSRCKLESNRPES